MNNPDNSVSSTCPDERVPPTAGIHYSSDISRRWEKINADMRQIQVSGVQGTDISAVYANTSTRRKIPPDHPLPNVGFSCMTREPADDEIPRLVDDAIARCWAHEAFQRSSRGAAGSSSRSTSSGQARVFQARKVGGSYPIRGS